jgi:surface antigen
MTTRFSIATFAVVSSAVLIFGNTAHTAAPLYLGNMQTLKQGSDLPSINPIPQAPSEVTPPILPKASVTPTHEPKFETLQVVTEITSEFKAPEPIHHPVTDPSNNYVWGQCTWYAKDRRPDLPNNLGNANTWYSQAAAEGIAVGSEPKAGAVGATTEGGYGHVVYVESVNDDGTVNISEMNYAGGVGVVHARSTPASEFTYIY